MEASTTTYSGHVKISSPDILSLWTDTGCYAFSLSDLCYIDRDEKTVFAYVHDRHSSNIQTIRLTSMHHGPDFIIKTMKVLNECIYKWFSENKDECTNTVTEKNGDIVYIFVSNHISAITCRLDELPISVNGVLHPFYTTTYTVCGAKQCCVKSRVYDPGAVHNNAIHKNRVREEACLLFTHLSRSRAKLRTSNKNKTRDARHVEIKNPFGDEVVVAEQHTTTVNTNPQRNESGKKKKKSRAVKKEKKIDADGDVIAVDDDDDRDDDNAVMTIKSEKS